MHTSGGHRLTQNRPIDVRAQLFAPDRAGRSPFNVGAAFSRHLPHHPVANMLGFHAKPASQLRHAARSTDGSFNRSHGKITHHVDSRSQQLVLFASSRSVYASDMSKSAIDMVLALAKAKGWKQTELADKIGVKTQNITNWKTRGLPPEKLAVVAEVLGCSVDLLLGRSESGQSQVGLPPVAHPVILDEFTVVPTINWESLLDTVALPDVFKLAAPDTSMAPKVPQGTMVEFTRSLQPRPGDGVLVKDRDGHHYLRIYREKRPGHWEAYAINDAYSPLDSQADGLTVVAVLTAVAGRWA